MVFHALAALLFTTTAAEPLPRVLVMIAEQSIGQTSPKAWWTQSGFSQDFEMAENTLGRALAERGFTVVDRRVLAGKVKPTAAIQSATPSEEAVKEFAGQSGAEVVILGKAVAVDAGPVLGTPMRSVQATLSARIVALDDARIIASGATTQAFAHVDATVGGNKALEKAAKKLAEELLPKLMNAWQSRVQTITCGVSNVASFEELKQVKNALAAKLGPSTTLTQRAFKSGRADLEIRFAGTGQSLAEALDGLGVGKKHVEVEGVSAATLSLKLAK